MQGDAVAQMHERKKIHGKTCTLSDGLTALLCTTLLTIIIPSAKYFETSSPCWSAFSSHRQGWGLSVPGPGFACSIPHSRTEVAASRSMSAISTD